METIALEQKVKQLPPKARREVSDYVDFLLFKYRTTDVYQLSDVQRKRVEQARLEWQNGQVIDNDDLFKEMEQWLDTE